MIGAVTSTAPTTTPDAVQHRKLVDAAHQFEAIFLQQMMKPFAADKEDSKSDDDADGNDTYKSMGVESMARAISQAGGLGIASSVIASVERQAHSHDVLAKPQN
ncbi:MAG: rod-binding protein, partial [Bryocella sp.]